MLGASGYTGEEVVRLLALHPNFSVAALTGESQAGKVSTVHMQVTSSDFMVEGGGQGCQYLREMPADAGRSYKVPVCMLRVQDTAPFQVQTSHSRSRACQRARMLPVRLMALTVSLQAAEVSQWLMSCLGAM